jgi:D-isomer specific 2-hydroxyacid dehydrogenase-like protein
MVRPHNNWDFSLHHVVCRSHLPSHLGYKQQAGIPFSTKPWRDRNQDRVPGYSPYAVAEHTIGIMLALNRKLHRAYNRVREGNFALDGLLGFAMHGKTIGIIGTGKIGTVVAKILSGFSCPTLAFDPVPNDECRSLGVRYTTLDDLLARSDIITLHCPLTPENKHMIDVRALEKMRTGVMLINWLRLWSEERESFVRNLPPPSP